MPLLSKTNNIHPSLFRYVISQSLINWDIIVSSAPPTSRRPGWSDCADTWFPRPCARAQWRNRLGSLLGLLIRGICSLRLSIILDTRAFQGFLLGYNGTGRRSCPFWRASLDRFVTVILFTIRRGLKYVTILLALTRR